MNFEEQIKPEEQIKADFNLFCAKTMGYKAELTTWFDTDAPATGWTSLRILVDCALYDPYNNMASLVPVVDKLITTTVYKPKMDFKVSIAENFRVYVTAAMERIKEKEEAYKQEFNDLCRRVHESDGLNACVWTNNYNPFENLEELIQVVEKTVERSGQSLRLEGGDGALPLDIKKVMIHYVITCGTMLIEENNRHRLDEETQVC